MCKGHVDEGDTNRVGGEGEIGWGVREGQVGGKGEAERVGEEGKEKVTGNRARGWES